MTMMLVADLSLFHSRHNMSTIDEDEEMKADHPEIEKSYLDPVHGDEAEGVVLALPEGFVLVPIIHVSIGD